MAAAVARQEDHATVAESSRAVCVGWIAERRLHLDPANVGEALHLVEAAAADHAHRQLVGRASGAHADKASTARVCSAAASVIVTLVNCRARPAGPAKSTST